MVVNGGSDLELWLSYVVFIFPKKCGAKELESEFPNQAKVKVIVIAQAIAIVNVVYAKILPPLSLRSTAEGHLALIFQSTAFNSLIQPQQTSCRRWKC